MTLFSLTLIWAVVRLGSSVSASLSSVAVAIFSQEGWNEIVYEKYPVQWYSSVA
jgi:hypothetical protein